MQVCSQCSRVNPPQATYCYHDGALLAGHRAGGPVNAGAAPFPSPFVFPSGEMCRNFDQLAMTCQHHWKPAVDLLKQGFLGAFLGGLGRADLAMAAQEAARFPDEERGLDQLLAKLPTNVLQPPRVKAEPSEINLGQIPMGTNRSSEIHLTNLGMRLVFGSVVSDSKWLTVGEGIGSPQKLFQFGAEAIIPIQIRGKDLKAGNKPLMGRLTIESNGGATVITVKADVPITPFADGPLAGALTPRQIAEKAKANPKESASLFAQGNVAQWYALNGWIYPVQGPNASGLGAVQQFFEALGLAKAPRIDVKTRAIALRGEVGQTLQSSIELGSPEKKPVFAHAVSDQAWVDVTKVKLSGNSASITVHIASVPHRPGETLTARITVTGNGNQRTMVPLTLEVGAGNPFADMAATITIPPPSGPPPWLPAPPPPPQVLGPAPEIPVLTEAATRSSGAIPRPQIPAANGPPPLLPTMPAPEPSPNGLAIPRRRPVWVHLVPLGMLAFLLVGFVIRDLVKANPDRSSVDAIDPVPRLGVFFDWKPDYKDKNLGETLQWGLVARESLQKEEKKLTFDPYGRTNQAMVTIDGTPRVMGNYTDGKWLDSDKPRKVGKWGGKTATWIFNEQVALTQHIEIIPGEPVEVEPGEYKRLIDTCLVRYKLQNLDIKRPHKVGFRFMLDTFIGKNDGVPFLLPGENTLLTTFKDFTDADKIPEFIQAYENNDLKDPGTIANLNLKPDKKFEPPSRVSLTHWPDHNFPRWDIPLENMDQDSAIVMYWPPEELAPGKSRVKEMAFTYGLGSVTFQGGKVGLTVQGSFVVGGELTVVALIADAKPGQTATLTMDPSLKFLSGFQATQPVPPPLANADNKVLASPVTWRIRSTEVSQKNRGFTVSVTTSDGLSQTRVIRIKGSSIF